MDIVASGDASIEIKKYYHKYNTDRVVNMAFCYKYYKIFLSHLKNEKIQEKIDIFTIFTIFTVPFSRMVQAKDRD